MASATPFPMLNHTKISLSECPHISEEKNPTMTQLHNCGMTQTMYNWIKDSMEDWHVMITGSKGKK